MTPRDMAMDPQDKTRKGQGKLKRGRGGSATNPSRRQSKKKKEEPDSDTENGEIRCLCGHTHDDGFSIQCERCLYWQHFVCYGITDSNVPDRHICNMCEPKTRKVTVTFSGSSPNPSSTTSTSPSHRNGQTNGNSSSSVSSSGVSSNSGSNSKPSSRAPSRSKLESDSDSDSSHTPDTDEINKQVDNDSPIDETIYVHDAPKRGRQSKTLKEKKKISPSSSSSSIPSTSSTSSTSSSTSSSSSLISIKTEELKRKVDQEEVEADSKRVRSESPDEKMRGKHGKVISSFSSTKIKTSSEPDSTLPSPTISPLVEKSQDSSSSSTTAATPKQHPIVGKKAWARQYREELQGSSTPGTPTTITPTTTLPNSPNPNPNTTISSTIPTTTITTTTITTTTNLNTTTPPSQSKFPKKKQIVQIEKLKEAKPEMDDKSIQALITYADNLVSQPIKKEQTSTSTPSTILQTQPQPLSQQPLQPQQQSPTLVKLNEKVTEVSTAVSPSTTTTSAKQLSNTVLSTPIKEEPKEDLKVLQSPDSQVSKTKFSLRDYQKQRQTEPKTPTSSSGATSSPSPLVPILTSPLQDQKFVSSTPAATRISSVIINGPVIKKEKTEELTSRWSQKAEEKLNDGSLTKIKTNGPLILDHQEFEPISPTHESTSADSVEVAAL